MDNQLTELIDRVASLENQNRFFKRTTSVCFALLCLVIACGAYGLQSNNTLTSQHSVQVFNLLNQDRITLAHTLEGTWLIMKDLNGRERVKIGTDNSNTGSFRLKHANGQVAESFDF